MEDNVGDTSLKCGKIKWGMEKAPKWLQGDLDYFDESYGGLLYILPWFWPIQLPCNSGGEMIS